MALRTLKTTGGWKEMKIKMEAKFKSKTISNYYTGNPDNYILSFHHYNIVVDNDSKEEYYLLEKDIELLRKYNKENSILYFSDVNNLKKIKFTFITPISIYKLFYSFKIINHNNLFFKIYNKLISYGVYPYFFSQCPLTVSSFDM